MAQLVLTIPNSPAGRIAVDHLRTRGQAELGAAYLQSLDGRVEGLETAGLLRDLSYSFHLVSVSDRDQIGAINRITQWHNGEGEPGLMHGRVESVEPNVTFWPSATLGLPFQLGGFHQAYLQAMKVGDAHQAKVPVRGSGITVAVIDSGADPKMPKPVQDFYDVEAGNPIHPAPQIDNDGHGTAMATLIQQVVPDATIHAVRVFDQNTLNLWNVLAGAGVAAFDCQADVVSISLGYARMPANCPICGASAQSRALALQYLLDGITQSPRRRVSPPIYVAATGNDFSSSGFNYPAAYDSAVAIGSVTSALNRSAFSNFGKAQPAHFFVAPGGQQDPPGIITEDVGNGGGVRCHGTSVATAYAAGMLALLWSDPRYQKWSRDKLLSEAKNIHCVPLPQGNPDPTNMVRDCCNTRRPRIRIGR